jgi:PKD repeat protein
MPRNRQLSRLVHVSRRRRKYPAQADSPMPRRRALRRFAVPAAAAALLLIVTQVVLAVPPSPVSFEPSDSTPTRGEPVTFTAAEATDPEGGTVTYDWNFGDGTTGSGRIVTHTYSSSTTLGAKTVTLTVTDSNPPNNPPETASVSQQVEVMNAPPTAAVSCSPETVQPSQATGCNTTGSGDPEGAVTYAWDTDGDGFDDGTGANQQFSFPTAGTRTIRLRVTDADGATADAQDTVSVNAPPTASVSCTPESVRLNEATACNASASDPDGGPISYAWDIDGDGFDDGSDASEQFSFPSPGTRTIRLRVTDAEGGTATAEDTVTVVGNSAPTAVVDCSPNQINQGDPVSCTGAASSDPDGENLRYEWSVDGGAFSQGGPTFSPSTLAPGNHTITLRVTDAAGETGTASDQVSVNAPPVARVSFADATPEPGQNPQIPLVGHPVTFRGDASSDEPPGTIAAYAWDIDGDGFDDGSGVTQQFSFAAAGPKTVALRVADNSGATDTETVTFRVNTPPVAGEIFNSPEFPIKNQPIQLTSTARDPDADALTYAWDLDNDGQFDDSTSPTPTTSFATTGEKTIGLRVTDTGGVSRTVTPPKKILIQDTVPTAGFNFAPEFPLPGQAVTFTSSSVASAGKSIGGLEWDFDYDGVPANFNAEAMGSSVSHAFASPGVKSVGLRATEVDGGFDIETVPVTVNAPPRAGFTVSPEEAFVGDEVTLSSTSADPDGPLTAQQQQWDLDNDGQFDNATAVVVSARFSSPGTYPLRLRVTDSRGATSTATGQVVIRTRPVPPPPPTPLLSGVVIEGRFLLFRRDTKVKFLRVRAPAGSKISVRCLGKKNCPKRVTKTSKGSKMLGFKKLQRRFRPKTKLIITVTKSGFIGRQTTFTLRRRKPPLRRDLCLNPGAKKATECPSG